VNLLYLLFRRLRILGTSLRSLDTARKVGLTRRFSGFALPRFADGRLRPVIDSVRGWTEVASAHLRMESNENVGKIVLRIDEV
jgi:NADPH:quinone reductase-like Zn-dependent oxidoreductase